MKLLLHFQLNEKTNISNNRSGEFDINNAKEFLDNGEYGLAFDTIITLAGASL